MTTSEISLPCNWREGDFFYQEKADHAINFIENYCSHVKAVSGRFILEDWQKNDIVGPLFGWHRKDGLRKYRFCYVEIPRKNGKSSLSAAIALYMLTGLNEQGAEIISAAVKRLGTDEIGWLEANDCNGEVQIPQEGAGSPQAGEEKSQEGIPLGKERKEGTEGKEHTAKPSNDAVAEQSDFLLSKRGRKLADDKLDWFRSFWKAFDDKRGRAATIDAFLDIPDLSEPTVELICAKAKDYDHTKGNFFGRRLTLRDGFRLVGYALVHFATDDSGSGVDTG